MSLVLDASATLAFIHEEETTPTIRGILDQGEASGALVPSLWRLEIGNSLLSAGRRGRITVAGRDKALAFLPRLDIGIDPAADDYAWATSLQLADRYRLTSYDSEISGARASRGAAACDVGH